MRAPFNAQQMRPIRMYALAALPFLLVFAYQLTIIFAKRPAVASGAYTIAVRLEGQTVYLSTADMVVTFGAFLIAGAIIGAGLWRTRPRKA